MHILIIPSWYPSSSSDIGGSFFREQALALAKNGCRVGVICPVQRSLRQWSSIFRGRYGLAEENDCGLPTLRWHGMRWFPRVPYVNRAILIRQGLRLFKEYVARHGTPDILHAHSTLYGGIIAYAINKLTGIPYVITEHSTAYARNLIRPSEKHVAMEAVMHASHLMAVSASFGELLQNYFGAEAGQWFPVPNIVSNQFTKAPLSISNQSKNTFTFLCVALLTSKKAIDNLIVSFADAFKNDPQVALRIGGDGPERLALEDLARSAGITSQVRFLGTLTREQVVQEMANTDVFVLPSHFETFGVVVIEALAMGKPVVATRCGGPESILRPQDGELVSTNDIQTLSAAMQKVRREFNDYNPQEIRKSCLARYGEAAITARLKAVYSEVLASNQLRQE